MCGEIGHVRYVPKADIAKIFDRYLSDPKKRIRRDYINRRGWAKASLLVFFQRPVRKDDFRYVHSPFFTEVLKNKQADRRG